MCSLPVIAVSSGDPSGVGLEVLIKAVLRMQPDGCRLKLCFHKALISRIFQDNPAVFTQEDAQGFWNAQGTVWFESEPGFPMPDPQSLLWGISTEQWGDYAFRSLELATHAVLEGHAQVLLTLPLSKQSFTQAGLGLMGHTEYLAIRAGLGLGSILMLFDTPDFVVASLTRHIPLASVCQNVGIELIEGSLPLIKKWLNSQGIIEPRMVLACLDPHCGEWGLMSGNDLGLKKAMETKPLLKDLHGPLAADGLFAYANRGRYDAYLCWYHDQAMIPVKMDPSCSTVNISLGLPFLRLSPAHGPAYDLAGKGLASEQSMYRALKLAVAWLDNKGPHGQLAEGRSQ